MKNDFMIIDEEDMHFVWDSIEKLQLIFHPQIAPTGEFDSKLFSKTKHSKPYILFLDRNILSSLLKLCEQGTLKNETELQCVGLVMAWAMMNDIKISAGFAIEERATQMGSQEEGLVELQKFLEIIEYYPMQMWLYIAEGRVTEIRPICYSGKMAQNVAVNYSTGNDHYYMALASMIHLVLLYRNSAITRAEKMKSFFKWMADNLLISEYLLTYAAMLFTEQEGIKAPKNAKANVFENVIDGCKNQAWDIAYLTSWSVFYSNTIECEEEFLFATNDVLLKRIFINQNNKDHFNGVLYSVYSKKEYNDICSYMEEMMKNRTKPDFGKNPSNYFEKLIEMESAKLHSSGTFVS